MSRRATSSFTSTFTFAFCLLTFNLSLAQAAPATMRADYYHSGNDKQESFALDRIVIEPLPWAGNPKRPLDTSNAGKYLFEVIDKATNKTVYSRGFSSIYGEWETTAEAQKMNRT